MRPIELDSIWFVLGWVECVIATSHHISIGRRYYLTEAYSERYVRVARIGKPHGIRGEVTVELFTDSPETRFVTGNVFSVHAPDGGATSYLNLTIEKARWHNKILLLKFAEFSDRNTAESLRNSHLYAAQEERHEGHDAWYADDLIGLTVHQDNFDTSSVGEIIDLITGAAQDLLEIRLSDGREV